eukprot:CAMPEP_0114235310 /NCGR_PEP_ID=MMETSP0058-20121206/6181_1 /TAXON_ID=36894 /ORGANISM="Pyramimonas parkeae, CCMP726" /LENGTH=337 /DNA_ID=CAMNT_0001347061 /DNA_START=238 /DNA_END=1251 /DNA_ORIENTATION=-
MTVDICSSVWAGNMFAPSPYAFTIKRKLQDSDASGGTSSTEQIEADLKRARFDDVLHPHQNHHVNPSPSQSVFASINHSHDPVIAPAPASKLLNSAASKEVADELRDGNLERTEIDRKLGPASPVQQSACRKRGSSHICSTPQPAEPQRLACPRPATRQKLYHQINGPRPVTNTPDWAQMLANINCNDMPTPGGTLGKDAEHISVSEELNPHDECEGEILDSIPIPAQAQFGTLPIHAHQFILSDPAQSFIQRVNTHQLHQAVAGSSPTSPQDLYGATQFDHMALVRLQGMSLPGLPCTSPMPLSLPEKLHGTTSSPIFEHEDDDKDLHGEGAMDCE